MSDLTSQEESLNRLLSLKSRRFVVEQIENIQFVVKIQQIKMDI